MSGSVEWTVGVASLGINGLRVASETCCGRVRASRRGVADASRNSATSSARLDSCSAIFGNALRVRSTSPASLADSTQEMSVLAPCTCRRSSALASTVASTSRAYATASGSARPLRRAPAPAPAAPPRAVQSRWAPPEPTAGPIAPQSAEALLRSQPAHYAVVEVHRKRYLVTPGDLLTLPRIKDVNVGDVIRLTRVTEVGSRDFTLRAPWVPQVRDSTRFRLGGKVERAVLADDGPCGVELRAVVVEHTASPMRKRIKHTMGSKHVIRLETRERYTRLRIGPVHIGPREASGASPIVDAAKRALRLGTIPITAPSSSAPSL